MYFSDRIALVNRKESTENAVFCDIESVYGNEDSNARKNGIIPSARAIVRNCDYNREKFVRYEGGAQLESGMYYAYRSFYNGDNVELYLTKKPGAQT